MLNLFQHPGIPHKRQKPFSHLLRKINSFFILLFKIYPYNCNTDYETGIRKRIQSAYHIARRQ